jgi:transglutaminase-like putative cysteine protease
MKIKAGFALGYDCPQPTPMLLTLRVLPDEVLVPARQPLLRDRPPEPDIAWTLFGDTPPGWPRVQAILDYVHGHIRFDYMSAGPPAPPWAPGSEQVGVCRDFAHLAVTFCRCMNIPARYCTGYLGDIGVPPSTGRWTSAPGSRSTWAAAGTPVDARNNVPRIGRILMARGRDATDVALASCRRSGSTGPRP